MPIYEYACSACGHTLEALQKVADDPLTFCPECGADTLRKKISAAAFRLKGSGWYETDFKTKKETKADASKANANGGSESKGESKSDGGTKAGDKGKSAASEASAS